MDTRRRVRSLSARSFIFPHVCGGLEDGVECGSGVCVRLPGLCGCCQLQRTHSRRNECKMEKCLGQTRLKLETISTMYVQIEECLSVSCSHHTREDVWGDGQGIFVPLKMSTIEAQCDRGAAL